MPHALKKKFSSLDILISSHLLPFLLYTLEVTCLQNSLLVFNVNLSHSVIFARDLGLIFLILK